MKCLIPLLLTLCLLVPFLIGCDTDKPVYTKHLPARTEDISWEDRMTEDAITVSSVLAYSKEETDLPGGISYMDLLQYTHVEEDGFYFPRKDWSGETCMTTIYHYDTDGTLTREIDVPCNTENTELFRVLSDGRILLLQTQKRFDFSKVFLQMIDEGGTVLCESPEFTFSSSVQTYLDNYAHDMHVTEREDGTMRILVNAIDRVYYFDESLALLSEITLPAECKGITPLSEGVYMIGSEMPAVCKVDLNTGTAEQTDVPVLPEMKYFSTFFCGGDGKLYCAYKDAVYLCQKNDAGEDTLHRLLNWYQGSLNGRGLYWIVNETCMFYIPESASYGQTTLYVLKPGSSPDLQNRRVLTLVSLSGYDTEEWVRDAVSLFNERNEDYYILYVDLAGIYDGTQTIDRFDSYLLDGNNPDMVLFDTQYQKYAKKNLLLDLSADYGEQLLGAARNAYTEGSGALHVLPLNMMVYTYACKSSLLDSPLTWEDMYALGDELKASDPNDHMALTTVDSEINDAYNLMRSYVDYETKTSSFHSDAFHRQVRFKEDMGKYIIGEYGSFTNSDWLTGGRYGIAGNTEIVSAMKDGRVKLLYAPLKSLTGYASLKLFFGDTPFSLCGYPSDDESRYAVKTNSLGLLSVFSASANLGGCKAFLDFLLSDDMQTSDLLTQHTLPVTRSALKRLMEENRYFYYPKTLHTIGGMDPTVKALELEPLMTRDTYNADTASRYTVIEITDEDQAHILSFFDNCISFAHPDGVIVSILNEELSTYRAGVRSLEETTQIIDSRVWIYLNE